MLYHNDLYGVKKAGNPPMEPASRPGETPGLKKGTPVGSLKKA